MGRAKKEPDLSTYSGRVAARLREFREGKGLTVEDIVDRLHAAGFECSIPAVYRWENGGADVPLDAVPILASIFGKSVAKFLPES